MYIRGKIKCLKKIFLRKSCSLSNLANIRVNLFSEFNATHFSVQRENNVIFEKLERNRTTAVTLRPPSFQSPPKRFH